MFACRLWSMPSSFVSFISLFSCFLSAYWSLPRLIFFSSISDPCVGWFFCPCMIPFRTFADLHDSRRTLLQQELSKFSLQRWFPRQGSPTLTHPRSILSTYPTLPKAKIVWPPLIFKGVVLRALAGICWHFFGRNSFEYLSKMLHTILLKIHDELYCTLISFQSCCCPVLVLALIRWHRSTARITDHCTSITIWIRTNPILYWWCKIARYSKTYCPAQANNFFTAKMPHYFLNSMKWHRYKEIKRKRSH